MDIKKYRTMMCPVCGEFEFSKLDDSDVECLNFVRCHICGWICDAGQTDNPDSIDGYNGKSLNEYRIWFAEQRKHNPDYKYLEDNYTPEPHKCPVCGKYKFMEIDSHDICPVCGWEDDSLMEEDTEYCNGANPCSLGEYRKRYMNQ